METIVALLHKMSNIQEYRDIYKNEPSQAIEEFIKKHGAKFAMAGFCTIDTFIAFYKSDYTMSDIGIGPEMKIDDRFDDLKAVMLLLDEIPELAEYIRIDNKTMRFQDHVLEETREKLHQLSREANEPDF